MPRRKKQARELTTQELLQKVFPKKVREAATQEAEKARKSGVRKSTKKDST
jgi:hypothetical protein